MIRRYWLVHYVGEMTIEVATDMFPPIETHVDFFRIFTDLSLLLRSLQKHVRKEPDSHPSWTTPYTIWSISEEPRDIRDVTIDMEIEADHAIIPLRCNEEEEPSPSPIFAAGRPL
jgi:hypothetical protein